MTSLNASEAAILAAAETLLDDVFKHGGEYPPGTKIIQPMQGYDVPLAQQYKDKIMAPFKAVVLATLRSATPKTQGNIPFDVNVTGTTSIYIGSVWLEGGVLSTIRAYLGCVVGTDTPYLDLKETNGQLIVELGRTPGTLAVYSESNITIPSDGIYNLWMSASSPTAVVQLRNLSWSYQS